MISPCCECTRVLKLTLGSRWVSRYARDSRDIKGASRASSQQVYTFIGEQFREFEFYFIIEFIKIQSRRLRKKKRTYLIFVSFWNKYFVPIACRKRNTYIYYIIYVIYVHCTSYIYVIRIILYQFAFNRSSFRTEEDL